MCWQLMSSSLVSESTTRKLQSSFVFWKLMTPSFFRSLSYLYTASCERDRTKISSLVDT